MLKASIKFKSYTIVAIILLSLAALSYAQDMKAEDIIAKHLDAIGTKEKRAEVQSRIARGVSTFESKLPKNATDGLAIMVTDANNLYFLSKFKSLEYPFEKIGIFSDKISLPFVTSGTRSPLGAFLSDHSRILSDGLFGGTISSLWGMQAPKGKIEANGKKKIDGVDTYVVTYYPKGGSGGEFSIKMFFDTANFRHVRTEYKNTLPPKQNKIGVLGEQTGSTISVAETFGDYKDEAGLMLPHSYKIQYQTDSNSGTYEYDWSLNISQYFFNQKLDPNFFTFDEQK